MLSIRPAVATAFLLAALTGGTARAEGAGLSLGFLVDKAQGVHLPAPKDHARPPHVRLVARWAEIESEKGVFDWSTLAPEVEGLKAEGFAIVVCLTGSNPLYVAGGAPPSPLEANALEGWLAFVRSAVRGLGASVGTYEVWDDPSEDYEPAIFAYVLKSSALALRAEARAEGVSVRVAQGAVREDRLEWQKRLWAEDAAPYVDVLPIRVMAEPNGASRTQVLEAFFTESARNPPAPALWVYVEPASGASPGRNFGAAIEALSVSAVVAFARVPEPLPENAWVLPWALAVHDRLAAGYAPAPPGRLEITDPSGGPIVDSRVLGRFFGEDFTTFIPYAAAAREGMSRQARLVVDDTGIAEPRVLDPATGEEAATSVVELPGTPKRRALVIALADRPLAVLYRKVVGDVPGLTPIDEALEVKTGRTPTAEEIVARHQQVQKVQDDRLERWTARGRIDFHFKLAQAGSSVDVSIESNYFWEKGGSLEWEQTTYYLNGNLIPWKTIPEIPFIQPEKVLTLPLDLTLDRTYSYRFRGEDEVLGRAAYVLEFEPASPEPGKSLYSGRVWVDKATFVRLKANVIQTNLEPPVVSNEETDIFEPHVGPDGETYWMLSRIDGQQLWTVGGRNFVVHREVRFPSFDLNPPKSTFEEARKAAYTSRNRMMRDTDQGYRYLERQEDGSRTVKPGLTTHMWFAAAGAYKDDSRSSVTPLAGVNYIDLDLLKKDAQLNVFFAGALAFVNLTDPAVFGRKIDLALDVIGIALKGDDRVYVGETEVEGERVRERNQFAQLRLGIPLGSFAKVTVVGGASLNQYFGADTTDPSFVLPPDHHVLRGTIQAELHRRGYTVTAAGTWSRRSDWAPWGLPGGEGQPPLYTEERSRYSTWGVTAFKEWFLPKFQKIRTEVNIVDGSNLDRFSRYQFSLFGEDRLNGFAGTGVRFDRALIARLGYSFNLFNAVRLDLALDTAKIRDLGSSDVAQRFTGAGFSTNVVGPWKTVISFSYGRAMASDVPELVGKQEFMLVILKLF